MPRAEIPTHDEPDGFGCRTATSRIPLLRLFEAEMNAYSVSNVQSDRRAAYSRTYVPLGRTSRHQHFVAVVDCPPFKTYKYMYDGVEAFDFPRPFPPR